MTAQELISKYHIRADGPEGIVIGTPATEAELSLIELAKPQILEELAHKHRGDLALKFQHIFDLRFSTDRLLAGIAWNAHEAICKGESPEKVNEQFEREMEQYWRMTEFLN